MLGHRPLIIDDYLAILKRRWWVIAIPAVLLCLLAIAATLYIPPQYVSQASVQIDQQKVSNSLVPAVVTEDIDNRLASINALIESRSSIQPIVEKFNLYADKHLSMDDRVALARKNKTIKAMPSNLTHSSGLPGFTISFTASDPRTAQLVCADITSLFISANLRSQTDATGGTTDFLQEQLNNATQTLNDQDAKLAAFQSKYFGMLPSDEPNNINILSSLNTQLEAANQSLNRMEQDKSYLDAMLAQESTTSPISSPSPSSATPQTQQQELQGLLAQQSALASQYTSNYPDVIAINRRIADLRAKMAQPPSPSPLPLPDEPQAATPIQNDSAAIQDLRARIRAANLSLQAMRTQQALLTRQIAAYQRRIQSTPQVEEQFKQLTRDTATSQALYDSDLDKLNQAKMATDLDNRQQGENFSLLDPANLPDSPDYPKRSTFAAGGLAGGLVLGLLFAALLEYRNTELRSERDVWAFTKLPTLAVIAWSDDVADRQPGRFDRLRHPFHRNRPRTQLIPRTSSPVPSNNHV